MTESHTHRLSCLDVGVTSGGRRLQPKAQRQLGREPFRSSRESFVSTIVHPSIHAPAHNKQRLVVSLLGSRSIITSS
jgi:hypothetical protein